MLRLYKRFCCGLFYLQSKVNPDVPVIMTFLATLFLFELSMFGIDSLIYLLFNAPDYLNKYLMYGVVVVVAIPNYFLIFKDRKFMEYYHEKLPSIYVIAIVILIFAGSLFLILQAGPRNAHA